MKPCLDTLIRLMDFKIGRHFGRVRCAGVWSEGSIKHFLFGGRVDWANPPPPPVTL